MTQVGWYADAAASVSTFRTLGNAATPQNIFTLEAGSSTPGPIVVRRLEVFTDSTAALTALSPYARLSYPTALPSSGTTLTKVPADSKRASNANVVARGATASDGGSATAITATAGSAIAAAFTGRLHTAVGQALKQVDDLLGPFLQETGLVVRPGEALLVQIISGTAADNANTRHYIVNCAWEETSTNRP